MNIWAFAERFWSLPISIWKLGTLLLNTLSITCIKKWCTVEDEWKEFGSELWWENDFDKAKELSLNTMRHIFILITIKVQDTKFDANWGDNFFETAELSASDASHATVPPQPSKLFLTDKNQWMNEWMNEIEWSRAKHIVLCCRASWICCSVQEARISPLLHATRLHVWYACNATRLLCVQHVYYACNTCNMQHVYYACNTCNMRATRLLCVQHV